MSGYDTIKSAVIGVPVDPNKMPSRQGVVSAFAEQQAQVEGAQAGAIIRATLASLNALTAVPSADIMAYVMSDPVTANNGIYQNTGTAVAPAWTRRGSIPQFCILATPSGGHTANAMVMTTDLPIPTQDGRTLIILPITGNNTITPPTVQLNGGAAMQIVTSSGTAAPVSSLLTGMYVGGFIVAGKFRLTSDIASAAIQTAAENALKSLIQRSVGAFANSTLAEAFLTANGLTKSAGTMFFNTTSVAWNYWDGSSWQTFPYATVAPGSITPVQIAPGYVLMRELPGGINNFYVNPAGGSDLNDGSIGSKWATYEFGLRRLKDNFKWKAEPQTQVVINGEPATTSIETVHNAPHGMIGAQGGAAVLIKGGAGTRIKGGYGGCYEGFFGSVIQFQDIELEANLTNNMTVTFGAQVYLLGGVKFIGTPLTAVGYAIGVSEGGRVYMTGACSIQGVFFGAVRPAGNGIFSSNGVTWSLTGGVHSSVAFVHATTGGYAQMGTVALGAFSGTGKRFQATTHGHISCSGGAINLPGDVAGTVDAGTFAIAN